jgi:hypothetical protein
MRRTEDPEMYQLLLQGPLFFYAYSSLRYSLF